MPVEWITHTVHASVVTNASRDYAFSAVGYSDDAPSGGFDGTFLNDEFWADAMVSNPGASAIRIYALNDIGTNSFIASIPPGTHRLLDPGADAYATMLVQAYRGDHGANGVTATMLEGDAGEMPATVTISGTFTYDAQHHYGQDIDAVLAPYTWRSATGDEVSTWEAPTDPQVGDNELYIGTVGLVGTDWDASGVPELGLEMYTLAVFQRVGGGLITGKYLGSERRFVGF